MTTLIEDKLNDVFFDAVMLNHPGGVITVDGSGSIFLPEPDHRHAAQFMRSVNDRLQEHDLKEIAAAAFKMLGEDPGVMETVYQCSTTKRSRKFMGATITLRWHDGRPSDWSALKITFRPAPLVD